MWIFCRKTSIPDTTKQRLRTSGDERRLLCVASRRLVFQPQVCTLMHCKADSHLACWLCACVRGNTSPYLEVVVVNWKSPDSRFTNCCLKKLCYFTPVSLTKTLLIKKLSGKKLEVLLAKNRSRITRRNRTNGWNHGYYSDGFKKHSLSFSVALLVSWFASLNNQSEGLLSLTPTRAD